MDKSAPDADPESRGDAATREILVREKAAEEDSIGLGARKLVQVSAPVEPKSGAEGVLRLVAGQAPPGPPAAASFADKKMSGEIRLAWELILTFVEVDAFLGLRATCKDLRGLIAEGREEAERLWTRGYEAAGYRRRGDSRFLSDLGDRLQARSRVQSAWEDLKNFMGPGFDWSLCPATSEARIQAMEDRFSLELPHELRESLMLHDGQIYGRVDPSRQPFPRLYSLAEIMGQYTQQRSRTFVPLSVDDESLELAPVAENNYYVNVRTGVVCLLPSSLQSKVLSVDRSWAAYLTVR